MRILFSFLMFATSAALASAPQFIELMSDKSSYTIGERAVLSVRVVTNPNSPQAELHLEGRLGGQPIKLTKISSNIASVVSPVLNSVGSLDFEVKAYLQDKKFARETELALIALNKEIFELNAKLSDETDPEKRDLLQKAILRDEENIRGLNEAMVSHRLLVETKSLSLSVRDVTNSKSPFHPALVLTADHVDNTYSVGDSAILTAHVYTKFIDTREGPLESVVSATNNEAYLSVDEGDTADHFLMTLDQLGSPGVYKVVAKLWVRGKARANQLRQNITLAEKTRSEKIALRDGTDDPYMQMYYQREVDDLTRIIESLYGVFDSLKTYVGETVLNLNVS